jgi:hypothetical protein
MLLDHIKYADPIFRNFFTEYFGRLSFPLFAFLAAESYYHTSNLKRYYKRLFIFGLISQIPFMFFRVLVGEWKMLNIMFTLLLGVFSINVYDKINKKYISLPLVALIIIIGNVLRVDYGWLGVLTVFLMYILRKKKMFLPLVYGIIIFIYYYSILGNEYIFVTQNVLLMLFTWSSTFIINQYNGEKGKSMKYFFYCFYPCHMLVVYMLHIIL